MALKIPPLLQFIISLLSIRLLAEFLPTMAAAGVGRYLLASLLITLAFAIAIAGIIGFHAAGTTIDPRYPERSEVLVTSGIYRLTRNPMYVALAMLQVAYCLYLGTFFGLLVMTGFILFMNRFQIEAEERALEQSFGDEYRRYKSKVRRWI